MEIKKPNSGGWREREGGRNEGNSGFVDLELLILDLIWRLILGADFWVIDFRCDLGLLTCIICVCA